ncbi:MAG: 2-oxoglutarate dehydrogenase complex dihydrolipoyllysine-residue succinyltransferase [Arenicella sp.]
MATEIKVPVLPESVADGTVAALHVSVGDSVAVDDNLVDIETEKVVLEVPSSIAGTVTDILIQEGDTVEAQQAIIMISEGTVATAASSASAETPNTSASASGASIEVNVPVLPESVAEGTLVAWHKAIGDSVAIDDNLVDIETEKVVLEVPSPVNGVLTEIKVEEGNSVEAQQLIAIITEGATAATSTAVEQTTSTTSPAGSIVAGAAEKSGPAVRKMISETGVDASNIAGTGKDGRLTKSDVAAAAAAKPANTPAAKDNIAPPASPSGERTERREPMSRIRSTIARRLKDAQNTQAMLTTFNDVDLSAVMDLRKQYKESFEKKHDARLGFMSFFAKASVEALKRFPAVNASIDGGDIVYHDYHDIGIAASSPRGLVVPVLRSVDNMSFADVEKTIADYGQKAKNGKLGLAEMEGGTFTITNGGVFGSMLSTPIVNPPQSAILGMHRIEQRPVAINGEVVIRPMMYLALTYDHRIIDGAEAVRFLVTIKQCLEDPARLLLEV